jgi:hypothetical protein
MISVRNHRQPLSGNKWFLFLLVAFIAAACSPKIRPVAIQPVKTEAKPVVVKPSQPVKPAAPKVSTIALLLPFDRDHLHSAVPYTSATLQDADIALDYYRGFKLALDSLTGSGYNYKLLIYDTKGDNSEAHSLAINPTVRAADLIVGPVFPVGLKIFTGTFFNAHQPIVSPLSPAPPASIKAPTLITMVPPLEYHAWSAAKYINDKIRPQKIFILRSGFSEENDYLAPFKKTIDSLSKNHIKVIQLTVVHGQLNSLIPQLSKTGKNIFVMPAKDQHFLTITLRSLDTLKNTYPVMLFGHPSWVNYSFLKPELLQRLDTHITSADLIDYKADDVADFRKEYKGVYHVDATDYAIKGFDEGLYLGKMISTDSLKFITQTNFTGLHNNFEFQKKPNFGWVNTHVFVYKYANFELKKEE